MNVNNSRSVYSGVYDNVMFERYGINPVTVGISDGHVPQTNIATQTHHHAAPQTSMTAQTSARTRVAKNSGVSEEELRQSTVNPMAAKDVHDSVVYSQSLVGIPMAFRELVAQAELGDASASTGVVYEA